MKSTVLLVACLSAITTFVSSSPQHSNFRNSHASTANQIRALINKQGSGPQTLQSETRKKRSMRPFGAVEGNKIKKRCEAKWRYSHDYDGWCWWIPPLLQPQLPLFRLEMDPRTDIRLLQTVQRNASDASTLSTITLASHPTTRPLPILQTHLVQPTPPNSHQITLNPTHLRIQ